MVTHDVGIIVSINESEVLCEALDFMLDHYQEFDEEVIRSKGNEFTMPTVGAQFKQLTTSDFLQLSDYKEHVNTHFTKYISLY